MRIKAWSLALEIRGYLHQEAKTKSIGQQYHLSDSDFVNLLSDFSKNVDAGDHRSVGRLERIGNHPHPTLSSRTVSAVQVGLLGVYWNSIAEVESVKPVAKYLLEGANPEDGDLREKIEAVENIPVELLFNKLGDGYVNYTDMGGDVLALVELCAPEETLIQDFIAFVREYKSTLGIDGPKKSIGENDFQKWHNSKVLAYLDLVIWFEYMGINPTHQQIGVLLFPDEVDVSLDDRIRRTVRPLALRLITPSHIAAIRTQADTLSEPA